MGILSGAGARIASKLAGGVADVAESVTGGIAEIKKTSSGDVSERDKQAQESYRSEYVKHGRTWFDVMIDGLNRTVRPLMAYGVIALFVIFTVKPEHGSVISEAWSKMPGEMIWLLGAVVTFYFGGRILEKSRR